MIKCRFLWFQRLLPPDCRVLPSFQGLHSQPSLQRDGRASLATWILAGALVLTGHGWQLRETRQEGGWGARDLGQADWTQRETVSWFLYLPVPPCSSRSGGRFLPEMDLPSLPAVYILLPKKERGVPWCVCVCVCMCVCKCEVSWSLGEEQSGWGRCLGSWGVWVGGGAGSLPRGPSRS